MPGQSRRPHPFFWLQIAAFALAVLAAVLAPDRTPAFALYWNPIYRAEIALVVLALVYLLGTAGWMAWHGQSFRRIELGGAAIERDRAELDAAAEDFDDYRETAIERMDVLEATLADVVDRVEQLRRGVDPGDPGVP